MSIALLADTAVASAFLVVAVRPPGVIAVCAAAIFVLAFLLQTIAWAYVLLTPYRLAYARQAQRPNRSRSTGSDGDCTTNRRTTPNRSTQQHSIDNDP